MALLSAIGCSGPRGPLAVDKARGSKDTPKKPSGPVVIAPLTGAPAPNPNVLKRPALVIKIDNADGTGARSRPQSGITKADVVYEERVEGSITRLVGVFHSRGSDPVGPIRSARSTDLLIVGSLNRPMFAWSGANPTFAAMVRSGPLIDAGYDVATSAYARRSIGGHVAPHDLYATTTALWATAPPDAKPPSPLFHYRTPGASPGAGARPVKWVNVDFGVSLGAPVDWKWDATKRRYLRFQRGTAHVDEQGRQVAAANVIVQFVDYHSSGVNDSADNPIPEAGLVGSGKFWALTGGNLVSGTWEKASPEAITTFNDANGKPIGLAPGQTWVELPVPGGADIKA